MDKKEFVKYLDEIFISYGFCKKGNKWLKETNDLIKIINIQKSKFGNNYYLNYGYILKSLKLDQLEMHIFNGFGSIDDKENQRIKELLDFENDIVEEKRKVELRSFIEKNMLKIIKYNNSEMDVFNELKKRPHLNDIPLIVKQHFNLE